MTLKSKSPKSKRYYSITEVCRMIKVPAHKLRYIEKTASGLHLTRIRGRRYYTPEDINKIQAQFFQEIALQPDLFDHFNMPSKPADNQMLFQIDDLLLKFNRLLQKIL